MLEVIGFDLEGCEIAQNHGAGRIELCLDPHLGGTTPDPDFIKKARALLTIPLFVMIRPRGGDFVYSHSEFMEMKSSIAFCKNNNVDGVVFGILTDQNEINLTRNKELMQLAEGMSCTFHRAFDEAKNPFQAANEIVDLGFDRILTSGQKPTAFEGAALLKELKNEFKGRLTILPGCGVTSQTLPLIDQIVQAKEYHTTGKLMDEKGNYLGVDPEEIKAMVHYLSRIMRV